MDGLRGDGGEADEGAQDEAQLRFGSELRRWRIRRGLSLAALSRRVHYSKGYLSKIENAVKPVTLDVARRCDDVLEADGALVRLVPQTPPDRTEAEPRPTGSVGECPYRGLAPFGTRHAQWFFGRERVTAALLERCAERAGRGPLVVVAASGAGKSSLLRAGLIPAVRRGALPVGQSRQWPVAVCTPTAHPLKEMLHCIAAVLGPQLRVTPEELLDDPAALRDALSRAMPGGGPERFRLVLVVDQFEEAFTLCEDEAERHAFVRAIDAVSAPASAGAPPQEPPAVTVLGMRADFCGRFLEHPELVTVLTHGLFALGPMNDEELRESITRPAQRAGLALEPGLVELLLRDLDGGSGGSTQGRPELSPGALPLLSHALLATWQQRQVRTLTVAGYETTGGIHGAIARTAENVFHSLDAEEQTAARRILVRLVRVREGGEEIRRRMPRGALLEALSDCAAAVGVLDAFVRSRLVTVDADTVTITHEALLRAWPRLHGWLQADRAGLLIHQQLGDAAAEWRSNDRDPAVLYRGTRLAAAREWADSADRTDELTPGEREFLDAALAEERDRQRADVRRVRQQRRLLFTLATLLALALGAGCLAYVQRSNAFEQRRTAQSQAMAVQSTALATGQPEASMLLAEEAYRTADTTEARGALLSTQSQSFDGRLLGHSGPVNAVAFSPDERTLATASSDGTVKLWRVADRALAATLSRDNAPIRSLAFSPDGRMLVTAASSGAVTLWDVATHAVADTVSAGGAPARSVAFSPDGRTFASGTLTGTITIWDAADHHVVATLNGHTDGVNALAFSPDGRLLASAGSDRTVRLWDTTDHQPAATLTGHSDGVLGVAFSPDGRTLASGSSDRTVRLWGVADHTLAATLAGHSDDVNAVAYTPDGATLISASGDGTAKQWDVASRRVIATLSGHTDYVQGLATSRTGLVATAGFDRSAVLWNLNRSALTAHPFTEVWKVAVSRDGHLLAAADGDHTVRLWDIAQHRQLATLSGHDGSVFGVAFSPDGRLLASAGADRTVRLWDVADRRLLATLSGHDGSVFGVAFSPDGRLLASAGADRTVRLWDVAGRRLLATLAGHLDFANSVAFSPDGRELASGSDDLTVRLWDVAGRQPLAVLAGHTGAVQGVAFAPDGRTLASSGNDGTVRLWDVAGRRQTAVLVGHTGSVRGVAFAPDGRTLASSGNDGTVRLWDVARTRLAGTLSGHTNAVWGVAFAPDGRTVASSSIDGTVRLWDVDIHDRPADICRLIGPVSPDRWARMLPDRPYRPQCAGS